MASQNADNVSNIASSVGYLTAKTFSASKRAWSPDVRTRGFVLGFRAGGFALDFGSRCLLSTVEGRLHAALEVRSRPLAPPTS